jgi:multidrug efflux pump
VVVGGLLVGTLLTLFVVPTVYTLLARTVRRSTGHEAPIGTPAPADSH